MNTTADSGTTDLALLRLLADGACHPVAELARLLDVTESRLDEAIDRVASLGLTIQRPALGECRLASTLDLIDAEAVAHALQGRFAVEVCAECTSTNDLLMHRARQDGEDRIALTCERQTAGRGRRGKQWQSAFATDLTFSLLWRMDAEAAPLSGLSLAVGVALVRALARCGHDGVQLKWPNDLLRDGRKLGGVLIEVTGSHASGPRAVVIGIGINVHWRAGRADSLDQPATGLSEHSGVKPARTVLLTALLLELHDALVQFERTGFTPFRDAWVRSHAWQGQSVRLQLGENSAVEGEALGVAEDGALLLKTESGIRPYHSGELRLVR